MVPRNPLDDGGILRKRATEKIKPASPDEGKNPKWTDQRNAISSSKKQWRAEPAQVFVLAEDGRPGQCRVYSRATCDFGKVWTPRHMVNISLRAK